LETARPLAAADNVVEEALARGHVAEPFLDLVLKLVEVAEGFDIRRRAGDLESSTTSYILPN
jgi:hypothetical protein